MDLKDKVVFITGSSRGIGAATALLFANSGCHVILNGRHETLPSKLEDRLKASGAEYTYLQGDIADEEAVKRLAKTAWSIYNQIDILVNNAGITHDKLLIRMKITEFDDVLNVNLRGTFMLTQQLLKKMFKQRSGSIINLASIIGIHGNAGQANYAASKAGIIGLTKTIAQEGALRGIRCNAVAPGMIKSDMTATLSKHIQKQILEKIPLKRLGSPQEVASTIKFLAQNEYITGQTLIVDGGMTI
ncbi:3-oxoacyl-[acyl-carrier-protein] reductase [Limosilactobacillus walteri]|uniref:3-oxoacyl-[acyl-carrier-protein] reductase n=1 Tax=Limosilactobacillus walteri TaxID=2268022 RepID=A0ABR8P991_9LACO|nr:3-oxoacyl-[acyl-carrier-protein] reductase [Limosilactobacillus walteri]MBD5807257.1 3-oxoacyl-[acyl-carrier-protein] reductase [Limosilactobacillus walteri]